MMRRRRYMSKLGRLITFLATSIMILTVGIRPASADNGKCGDWNLAMLVQRHANHEFAMFPVYPGEAGGELRIYIVECFNSPSFQVNGSVTWNGLSWNTFVCECPEEGTCNSHHETNPGTPNTVTWIDSGGCTTTGIYDSHDVLQNPNTWNCEDLNHPPECI